MNLSEEEMSNIKDILAKGNIDIGSMDIANRGLILYDSYGDLIGVLTERAIRNILAREA